MMLSIFYTKLLAEPPKLRFRTKISWICRPKLQHALIHHTTDVTKIFLEFCGLLRKHQLLVCFGWLRLLRVWSVLLWLSFGYIFYSNLFSTYCGAPVLNEPLFSGNIIIIPAAGKSPACKYFQMKRQYSVLYLVGGHKVSLNYIQFRLEVKNSFMCIINSLP